MSALPIALKKPVTTSTRRFTPHKYQEEAIEHLLSNPHSGLFLSPGLGKTAVTLQAVRLLLVNGAINRVLVLAPLRVIYNVWPREMAKWANFTGMTYSILHGNKKDSRVFEDADIYLCNPEAMKWLNTTKIWSKVDMLVVDESSTFRNSSSQRFKLLKSRLKNFDRRVILTGTPTPNGLSQLWSQLFIVDLGVRLEPFLSRFQNSYFYPRRFPTHTEWVTTPAQVARVKEKIKDVILYKSNDELDLPPLSNNYLRVDLPNKALNYYHQLRREFMTHDITAINSGVLANKLRQVAGGSVYADDGSVTHIHNAKLDALSELIEEQNGSPLLVFYQYRHDVEQMRKVYDAPVLGGGTSANASAKIIDDWNNDRLPVLYLHPASAGHGLNLQEGSCRAACWFNITWDLEHYEQAVARIHRQGQSSHVVLHHIVANDTIDDRVLKAIRRKADMQKTLMNYLKGN